MVREAQTAARGARGKAPKARSGHADQRSSVQSLAKGFRILESFSDDADEMTLSEVAQAAGLDPGTTYRMLNTLVALGYVAKVPDSKRFTLTLKVLDLGFHAIGRKELRAMLRPTLRTLVDEVSEAASFGVLDGSDVLYIERVRAGFTRLGVDIRLGTRIPAAVSTIGQAILAFLPPDRLKATLDQPSSSERAMAPGFKRADLLAKLGRIRRDGFVVEDSQLTAGLRVIAMPVLDPDGLALGAISVAAPSVHASLVDLRKRALGPLRTATRTTARALEAGGSTAGR